MLSYSRDANLRYDIPIVYTSFTFLVSSIFNSQEMTFPCFTVLIFMMWSVSRLVHDMGMEVIF